MITWKFRILNYKNSGVIFIRKERSMATFFLNAYIHPLTHWHTLTGRISLETCISPKYDYTTKPHAVIQNYFRKQLHHLEPKHCFLNGQVVTNSFEIWTATLWRKFLTKCFFDKRFWNHQKGVVNVDSTMLVEQIWKQNTTFTSSSLRYHIGASHLLCSKEYRLYISLSLQQTYEVS